MVRKLSAEERFLVEPLIASIPVLKGIVSSIIDMGRGTITAGGDSERPEIIAVDEEFLFFAGDPGHPEAKDLVKTVIKPDLRLTAVAINPSWYDLIVPVYGGKVKRYDREAFKSEQFDPQKLSAYIEQLDSRYKIRRIALEDISPWTLSLSKALVSQFTSPEDFMRESFGFGIFDSVNQIWVAGISAANQGRNCAEIEVEVHPEHRGRGLATAIASAFILHCLEIGITPCWDAYNPTSATVARKLGFISAGRYPVIDLA